MTNEDKILFYGFILLVLIASALYLPKAILIYSGYCWEEQRYLTTQEKFDIAVTELINEKTSTYVYDYSANEAGEKISSRRFVKKYQYSGLKEFYGLNPDCCFFVKQYEYNSRDKSITFRERLSGDLNTLIYIKYIFAFDEQNNNKPIYNGGYFGLSNCGKLSPRV